MEKSAISVLLIGLLLIGCAEKATDMGSLEPGISFNSAQEALPFMLRGINLGNTLEPDEEGGWNNGPAQEYYFEDYKTAGFTCVRVPVKWGSHALENPPYTIDPAYMIRVEQVIDWGLNRNLFIILNAHHEDWLKADYTDFNKARFDSIWSQISRHFKNKSERLLFEMINEPFGMTAEQVDNLNLRLLPLIRAENPTRIVIYSGNEWSGLSQMMGATVPDDENLMAYWHSYDPWSFAGEGQGTWGTGEDRSAIEDMFQEAADWSAAHNIPVMVSEFGAVHACDYNSRMRHYATYVENAIKHNIPFQAWDDGGNFGIYDRAARAWPEVKDILIHGHSDGPTDLLLESMDETRMKLSWTNRGSGYTNIRIERREDGGIFAQIGQLPADEHEFIDSLLSAGSLYDYRVLGVIADDITYHSYPIRQMGESLVETRAPYHGQAMIIPGTIQAEDYDRGGEGEAYHDTDAANIPDAYRPQEGVDIEARDDGGFQIAYLEAGEWLEYSINVPSSRAYTISTHLASLNGGATFRFLASSAFSPTVTVPSTNSWQTLTTVQTTLPLTAGEHILRFEVVSQGDFNVDYFIIQ